MSQNHILILNLITPLNDIGFIVIFFTKTESGFSVDLDRSDSNLLSLDFHHRHRDFTILLFSGNNVRTSQTIFSSFHCVENNGVIVHSLWSSIPSSGQGYHMIPSMIRVRIDPPHPLVCIKRRLNGAVLRMRPEKPRSRVTAGVAR
jgi:hypothetical protein